MGTQFDLLLDNLGKCIKRKHAGAGSRLRVGVLGGPGHGDVARAIAFAQGVKAAYSDAHIVLLCKFTGDAAMVEYDMAHAAGEIGVLDGILTYGATVDKAGDEFVVADNAPPRSLLVSRLRQCFDVLYDCVPYAVKAYWSQSPLLITGRVTSDGTQYGDWSTLQACSDQHLAPFRLLYDGHPVYDWRLKDIPLSLWTIMSESSGIEVTTNDLTAAVPAKRAPWPPRDDLKLITDAKGKPAPDLARELLKAGSGTRTWDASKLPEGVGDYVVLHNTAGYTSGMKTAPPAVFNAVASFLESEGIACVQVGDHNDVLMEHSNVIDRRSLRLPWTCRILKGALCAVCIEGFIPYMTAGISQRRPGDTVPTLVLFGSTPGNTFGFPCHTNMVRANDEGTGVACPAGTCFKERGYGDICLLGKEANPQGYCLNIPSPERVARAAVAMAKAAQQMRDGFKVALGEGAKA